VVGFRPHIRRIGQVLATSSNRIAFAWALRGTIAVGIPLLCLPPLGFGPASHLVAVGALNTSMVDVGGSYRSRLNAMTFNSLVSPLALILGTQTREPWWLAGLMIFLVALGSGMARAIGPGGAPLGLMVGVAFLIGTNAPADLHETIELGMLYLGGGLWTTVAALVFWRVRPFKRLEQEVAAVWERTAALIGTIHTLESDAMTVVGRRRRERALAGSHKALREAVERARTALGTGRAELSGPGTITAQLMILVRAASRTAAAGVTLAEIRDRDLQHRRECDGSNAFDALTEELESLRLPFVWPFGLSSARDPLSFGTRFALP
jgi:FUSC-like inner membrane protein yccS